jgi:chromosome segregation ATPase
MKASSAEDDLPVQLASADPAVLKGLQTPKQRSPEKPRDDKDREKEREKANLSYAELLGENQILREENRQLREHEEQLLGEVRQKYLLIVDSVRSDEEQLREHYAKQEAQLQHEKSELIDKIVRLGEDIDKLKDCEKYYLQEISTLQARLSSAIKNKGDEEYESVSPSSMAG